MYSNQVGREQIHVDPVPFTQHGAVVFVLPTVIYWPSNTSFYHFNNTLTLHTHITLRGGGGQLLASLWPLNVSSLQKTSLYNQWKALKLNYLYQDTAGRRWEDRGDRRRGQETREKERREQKMEEVHVTPPLPAPPSARVSFVLLGRVWLK